MGLSHPLEDLFCCCCCCGCNDISNHWGLQTLEDLFCCWWFLFSRNNQHWKTYLCCCVLQHHFTRFRAGKSCCEEWLKILRYKHPLTKTLGLESIFWKGLFSVVFSLFYKIGQKVIWTGYKIGHFLISCNFIFVLSVSQLCRWLFGNFTQPEIYFYEQGPWKQCCTNFLKAKCMNDIKNPIEGLWKYLESMSNTVLKAIFGQIIFLNDATHNFTYIHLSITNEDQYWSAQNIFLMKYFHRSYFHLTT